MINAELAHLDSLFFFFSFWDWVHQKADLLLPLTVYYSTPLRKLFLHFSFPPSKGEVERFLYRQRHAALCSFSSAAHLVGYYVKEMESIAEQWVTLFTGKSDNQRQGITPSWSDVSWKIPLFRGEEGKVQKNLGYGWHDRRNVLRGKGRRTHWISVRRYSPSRGRWDSKKCQECKMKKKDILGPVFIQKP